MLYVGHRGEHKNFQVLSEAFRLPVLDDFDLVAVGGQPVMPAAPSLHHLANVPDSGLRCAYAGAAAFVFPSLCEGFGLPLLEAMSCGAPIAASDIPTNREVAGAAFIPFDPADPRSCAESILQAAGPARARLLTAARDRLPRFSWTDCAARTLRVYRQVLNT